MGVVIKENFSTPEDRMSLIEKYSKTKKYKLTGQRKESLKYYVVKTNCSTQRTYILN
jgi:hypothetical protein